MVIKTLLTAALAYHSLPHAAYSQPGKQTAGTDSRQELEYKLSYSNIPNVDRNKLAKSINKVLLKTISKSNWAFPEHLKYTISKEPVDFAFRDIYFDTPDLELAGKQISYRLRHRWKRFNEFLMHQKYPENAEYFPIRCEIQLKTDYQENEDGLTLAEETRFEFRNESLPFSEKKDAPPPPWPADEYSKYAISGMYKSYKVLPYQILAQTIPANKAKLLGPSLILLTERVRSHINMPNKWGWGPNPDQIFIITLDHSRILALGDALLQSKSDRWKTSSALEFEIEIDRSVMTNILQAIDGPNKEKAEAATQAKQSLQKDLKIIRDAITKFMKKNYASEPGSMKSKYRRFTDIVRST